MKELSIDIESYSEVDLSHYFTPIIYFYSSFLHAIYHTIARLRL